MDRTFQPPSPRRPPPHFSTAVYKDLWAACDAILGGVHQCCLFHLLNELVKLDQRNLAAEGQAFARKTKRLIQNALRLRAQADFTPVRYASRVERLYERLMDLALARYTDADARRLAARREKCRDELFTFLSQPEVPATNNHGEREVRFAVLIRKIMYGNRNDEGALTQGVLMTVFRTLKTARLQSYSHHHLRPAGFIPYRATAAFPTGYHFRRVTCYREFTSFTRSSEKWRDRNIVPSRHFAERGDQYNDQSLTGVDSARSASK